MADKRKVDINRSTGRTKKLTPPKTPKVKSKVIERAKFDATGKQKDPLSVPGKKGK